MSQAALNKDLWRDSIRQYKQEGYYIARQLVPRAPVERVFSDMHRLAVQQLQYHGLPYSKGETAEDVHKDLRTLFSHDLKTYIATLTLCAKLVSLYELYLHPNLRAFIASCGIDIPVWQTGPIMHLMSHSLKVPGGYQGFVAHQDWPSQQGGLDGVTVWIPFVDVDRNRFPLDLIPGSHKGGLRPTCGENSLEIKPECFDSKDFISLEANCGDVVFMSCFMIHRSNLQGDERLRVSTSIRYENASEPHFISRNYPAAQKRSVIRELITPDFPSGEQVRRTFE
jgi:hypothetical protein